VLAIVQHRVIFSLLRARKFKDIFLNVVRSEWVASYDVLADVAMADSAVEWTFEMPQHDNLDI
jgi:hypothetical protein